jgi:superfamily II DNA or RNA helicase
MPWSPGQLVRHLDNPGQVGTVTDKVRERRSGIQYQVNWNGQLEWHYENELTSADLGARDPLELLREGRYGRVDGLRQLLTHVHLAGRLANVVYAMGLTETDFYAHQYKPLLTLLDSPVNGLLIADEVGLGKTIEAGLIWTELRARYDKRRLLVVCPAMLREKWRQELSARFGLDARIVNAEDLLQELGTPAHRERAWIVSYQGIKAPSDWDPDEANKRPRQARARLADLLHQHADQDPLLDLVIFDEAHYMRNEETGAWTTGSLLREVSDYQLMLSATPINLDSNDLFNLLRLLDPDHFERPEDFRNVVWGNRPVVAASDVVRNPASPPDLILQAVRDLKTSPWLQRSERVDRLIEEVESVGEWTHARRIDVAAKLERLNLLAHIVTRTRKREVQSERVLRDPAVFEAEMAPAERQLYDAITQGTREYALLHGIDHGFLLATPQRMVASSPAALAITWLGEGIDEDALSVAMDESDADEDSLKDQTSGLKQWLVARVRPLVKAAELRREDSKFAKFLANIQEFVADDGGAKGIVFTTFRGTARYLVERLADHGIKAALLMGGPEFDKDAVVAGFREDSACRLMVCTDVAAEGVDLQFCRLVVNYDLPWNPMRIEQRIGRIDRIGQQSKRILVWNFVHKDTIDARILTRLAQRVGVFESTLGGTEEILGQVRKLEDILLSKNLLPWEEAQLIEEAALAIEASKQKQEELEREAIQLVAHGQQLLTQIETARGEGRHVTRHDLLHYVDGHLRAEVGSRLTAVPGDPDTFDITLSANLAAELDEFVKREGLTGKTGLVTSQTRRCRFSDKIAERARAGEEVIHRFHPIVSFLAKKSGTDEIRFPLYAARASAGGVPPGRYALATRLASFAGVRDEEHLLVAAVPLGSDSPVDERTSEALLESIRTSGMDWPSAEHDIDSDAAVAAAEQCEDVLRDRYRGLKGEKQRENLDRAGVLTQLIDDHVCKKQHGFERRIGSHEAAAAAYGHLPAGKRRRGLANAERKKLQDFLARMETRKAVVERKRSLFEADSREVCVVIVEVTGKE